MAMRKSLYMFSNQYPRGHFLVRLDISVPENRVGEWKISRPRIVGDFSCHNFSGRNLMGCGRLGSKLFILGGKRQLVSPVHETEANRSDEHSVSETDFDSEESEEYPVDEYPVDGLAPQFAPDKPEIIIIYDYPLDVMVFDPTAPDPSSPDMLKSFNISPMNHGKISPLMFEVEGKLFVLGAIRPFHKVESLRAKIFEKYDPEIDKWETLPSPPMGDIFAGLAALVLDSCTVLIQCNPPDPFYIFNPKDDKWTRLEIYYFPEIRSFFEECPLFIGMPPLFIGDSFYLPSFDEAQGLKSLTFRRVGLFPTLPISPRIPLLMIECNEVAKVEWGEKAFPEKPFLGYFQVGNNPMMVDLGDFHFCVLESSSFSGNSYSEMHYGNYFADFNVCILKVTRHDKGSLEAECLHSARFVMKSGDVDVGRFTACHVLNNVATSSGFGSSKGRSRFRSLKRKAEEFLN